MKNLNAFSILLGIAFGLLTMVIMPTSSYGQFKGTYVIDTTKTNYTSNPAGLGGYTYKSFATAIYYLRNYGVSGPVIFNAASGTYKEQVTIGAIAGASMLNTIKFQSTAGDSSKCIIQYPSGTTTTDDWALQINGAKWITFSKIGFQRTGTNAYFSVVQLLGSASHITISHCWLNTRKFPSNTTLSFTTGYGSDFYFSGECDTTLLTYNFLLYGYSGFFNSGITCSGNTISYNVIDTVGCAGMYMLSQNNFTVLANSFNLGDFGATAGQYVSYGIRNELSPSAIISKNKIYLTGVNANTCAGMVLNNTSTPPALPCLVSNNFIYNSGGTAACRGIAFYGSSYLQVIDNNILITNALSAGGGFFGHPSYFNNNMEIRDNNVINKGGGYAYYFPNSDVDTFDYNNGLSTGSYFGYWGGSNYATSSAWNTASGKNAHGINVDPGYISNTNLHVSSISVYHKGTPNIRVKDDIDGTTRNAVTPTIGAHEFSPVINDAGVSSVDSPQVFCAGLKNIKVTFGNDGFDTITSIKIGWTINGIAQTTYSWTGSVLPGNTSSSTKLGSYTFLANVAYTIKVWTSLPNGIADGNHLNDTIIVTRYAGMSGGYTINAAGGANYKTFNGALADINIRGLCGPTTFTVTPGTYTEQLTILPVPGMGVSNPITFQSSVSDSTKVLLQLASSNTTGINNALLQLNGVSYFTFKGITIQRTGLITNTTAEVVHIKNGANNNTFTHCQIIGLMETSALATGITIWSDMSQDNNANNNNVFTYNYVKGGSNNMTYIANNKAIEHGTVIQNNIFDSSYTNAVQIGDNYGVVIQNNIFRNIRTYSAGNSELQVFRCDSAVKITGNYFYDTLANYAILMDSCTATAAKPGIIANNFIAPYSGTGINLDMLNYENVVFNSIYYWGLVTTNVGIATTSNTSTNLVLEDNNIDMAAGYVYNIATASQIKTSDYNNLYDPAGGLFAMWGGTSYSTLALLSTASSQDKHSIGVNPVFYSKTNLHIKSLSLLGAGTPITGITTDIDGQLRNTVTPCIGADEITNFAGAYTINPNNAASSTNYKNWASAAGDLLTGTRTDGGSPNGPGITGAVTFTAYDQVYTNTQVQLTAIKGASKINTVTFKSTAGDSTKCVIQYPSGTGATDDYALMLNGAKYVTFKNIGFQRTGTNTYSTVVQILGNASNNTITSCYLRGLRTPSNSTNSFAYGIGSCIYFIGEGDTTTITKNTMLYGYNGVYDLNTGYNNTINNNNIDTAGSSGIYMGTQTNLVIQGNSIFMGDFGLGSGQYTCYGMRIETSPSVQITKNKVVLLATNASVCRALLIYSITSTAAQPTLVINNFVVNSAGLSTASCTGITNYGAAYSQILFNNVLITNTAVAGGSAYFHNPSFTGSPVEIRDNNFINTGNSLCFDANGSNATTDIDTLNYNNYWTTGTNFGNWNGSTPTSFALWKAANGKDANSLNVNPGYVSNTDLHITNVAIHGKGIPNWRVTTDIDGQARNATTPDIGADEGSFGLIGAYTINPNNAASSTNYKNWASAVNDLLLGTRTDGGSPNGPGISSAVTFTAFDMVYTNTQVQLTAIKGASKTKTITFKSTAGDSTKCVIQYPSGTGTTDDYALMLNGAKYIIFKNIGFQRTGTNTYNTVVQILGSASNNTITHCYLRAIKQPSNSSNSFAYGIGSCIYFIGEGDTTTISNNTLLYGYNGIYNLIASYGNTITNNLIDTAGSSGIYMGVQTNLVITGNAISMGDFGVGSGQYTCYGMRIETSPGVQIKSNKILLLAANASVARALIIVTTTSTAAQPALIINNFVINSAATYSSGNSCTGITNYGAAYTQILFNNVLITNSVVTGGSAYFHNASYTGSPVEIRDNNFINKGGSLCFDASGANATTDIDTLNYNNYYTTGSNFGNWNGSTPTSFSLWKTTTLKDANSMNVDPGYKSNTDLHVSNSAIHHAGIPNYRVKVDIDGQTRNTTTPDIGADENFIGNDAGIIAIPLPLANSCSGTLKVTAVLKNFADSVLKSDKITWSINKVPQTPYNYTKTLASQQSDTVVLGTYNFTSSGNTTITVRSNIPNGKVDQNSTNDSLTQVRYINALPTANAGPDINACLGDSVLVGPTSSSSYNYLWKDGASKVYSTKSQFYFKPNTPVTLFFIVTNKTTLCVNEDTINIKTTPKPTPNAGVDQSVCTGASALIGSASQTGYSYNWTSIPSGYTSIIADPTVSPTDPTTYYILKMTNSTTLCYAYDTVKVMLLTAPTPMPMGDTIICSGSNLLYTTAFDSGSSYMWKVTGGSIVSGQGTDSAYINWTTPGSGSVQVLETNVNKCMDSSLINVTVYQNPVAKMFTYIVCSGSMSGFADSSTNDVSRIWNFGDGHTSMAADTVHIFTTAGNYNVKLIVTSSQGCMDSTTQSIIVKNAPKADFTIDAKTCVGENVTITNTSTNASSYFWNLGNTQTSTVTTPPAYSYSSAGTFNVKLVAYGANCKDSMTMPITVNPNPVAKFVYSQTASLTIQFTDSSNVSAGSIASWLWNFGDVNTATSQDPSHVYTSANSYNVKLVVTSAAGCVDSISKSVLTTVGIDQLSFDKSLIVYPNPSNGHFTIKSSGQYDLIEIVDALGKTVSTIKPITNKVDVDLSGQSNGIYFIKLYLGDQSTTVRYIINR